jgi:hypothetical protein
MIICAISIIVNFIIGYLILRNEHQKGLDITLSDIILGIMFCLIPFFVIITYLIFEDGIVIIKGKKNE